MSSTPMRIGMLGGTFDPVHLGHLRSAVEVREALELDRLHMIPAPQPPLRDTPQVSPEQRFELLRLGISDTPGVMADDRELRREGPSYSVDTLAELRQAYGDSASLVMIIGFDAFLRLAKWHKANQIFSLAHLVVIARPGYNARWPEELRELVGNREVDSVDELMRSPNGNVLTLALPSMMAISATYIRERLEKGKSVRYLLPEAVEEAILRHGFYHSGE
ncbi:nicotinate-nucleotide adenylyltransferase [Vreelandella sp. 21]|uniref:Probable nicotinate-nucleotide adenylyltransferase n=1 Tax=Vreelandella alkaliphila TaxID=272774 RepID=A0AAJ2S454_9GAMM|nr:MULTISPECIES: nicotinate-nucleotide adenylyltransferase [Halomonas]AIA75844.1 nicotinate-nucleotide adenylyltransferase [Halomonas campaniensis]MCD6006319.1 nicotinate-nucleotide adenylyltransferase [Halomonas sp. IOP_6]MCD6439564.1 nicotinate-nucleotide adenylyltransferase [Halomonas sp.]MDX5979418.1 nicotinate-nucleotide adenylyltransferase [Halomonas alkaliphila]